MHYTLDDNGNPVPETYLLSWAKWMETADRTVKRTRLDTGEEVSTVFLGLDHSLTGNPPLLHETMIFGGRFDNHQQRYATRDEAAAAHDKIVAAALDMTLDWQPDIFTRILGLLDDDETTA